MLEVFGEIVAQSVAESKKNRPVNPQDYFVDGLLYCGKCRTPRQTRVTAMGIVHEPYVPCACERAREHHTR